jgi:hypothetical protein
MGRKARVNFRARISLRRLQTRLHSQPVHDWPPHLLVAWKILTSELRLPDRKARSVILNSVSASHRCVAAQNEQLHEIARIRAQRRIRTACIRIPNCINRAPASLRRRLNLATLPLIEESINLEILESILETSRAIFESSDDEPARAAFESLKGVHFSALSASLRDGVQKAIADFKANTNQQRTAAHLFIAMGAALNTVSTSKASTQISNHIVRYLVNLAAIWRQAGLKLTVAHEYLHLDPSTYRSRFHQFAELVLGSMMEPRERVDGSSRDNKPWIEASMRSEKYKWLVSYEHMRCALRR